MSPARPILVRRAPAVELLRPIPSREVSLLLTDPPYQTVDRHGGGYLTRWFRGSLSWTEIGRVLALARRRMSTEGLAMVVVNEAGLADAQAAVRRAGFVRQRLVVWDQQRPGLGSGLRHQVGYVVVGLQPASRSLSGRDLVTAASVAPGAKDRYPAEKPVQLGRELAAIAGVRRGDTVVDPFCGSGNLLVGAVERGARVIAGDTSARAVRLATARLKAVVAARRPSLDSRQILGTRRSPASIKRAAKKPARRPAAREPSRKGPAVRRLPRRRP